jgi:hypothetical protein
MKYPYHSFARVAALALLLAGSVTAAHVVNAAPVSASTSQSAISDLNPAAADVPTADRNIRHRRTFDTRGGP